MASHRRFSLPQTTNGIRDKDYQVAIDTILDHQVNPIVSREPCFVLPHVYVGDINNAESYKTLRKYDITYVLNCAGYQGKRTYQGSPYEGLPVKIHYKEIRAQDNESYDISQHFDEAFRYLDTVRRKNGCALVHCAMGINRSVAICAAYLMLQKGLTLFKTVTLLKRRRGAVLNNRAFQLQLVQFARACGLLDSHEEFDKVLPKRLSPRNGFTGHTSEGQSVKPLNEMNGLVKYKSRVEPELSFVVTRELRTKDTVSKFGGGTVVGKAEKQSKSLQSDALIENYMQRLMERSAAYV